MYNVCLYKQHTKQLSYQYQLSSIQRSCAVTFLGCMCDYKLNMIMKYNQFQILFHSCPNYVKHQIYNLRVEIGWDAQFSWSYPCFVYIVQPACANWTICTFNGSSCYTTFKTQTNNYDCKLNIYSLQIKDLLQGISNSEPR